MRLIDLGEIALTETSLVMAFEKLIPYQFEPLIPGVTRASKPPPKGDPIYQTMMRESLLTVPRQLVFQASRVKRLEASQVREIAFRVDHYILDRTWFLSLGGFIAHAVEPQK